MQNLGQDSSPESEKGEQMMSGRGEASSASRKPSTPHSSNNSSPTKSDTDHLSEITTPRFLSDSSESEDEDVSLVESFVIDQVADLDETEARIQTSKFLLTQEEVDSTVDPETQARLEALLEAAGIGKLATGDGKQLADPEVLRRLTSSVSCALDEAAAALTRMRSENSRPQPERSLVEACSDGDVGTVRKLLTEGRSVHETTDDGESLLSLACSAGYYELAQVLLAMHANVEDRGIKGDCTPLMEAASSGYVDIVRLLIHHGAEVNAQSSSGNTPLMYACAGGHVEAVRVLLDAGANVEEHNENGHTPLMEAASAGHVPVAEILLERGAGINTHSNEFKESALTLACYKGHLDMVRFLLEAGADQEHKTDEMHTALMEASMDGHVEVARLLLDSGAQVNMPTDSFESPLTLAACGGHVELAVLLIERGANIEEVNDEGYTPLMEAAREGHEDMVALLLNKGANINAQTEETQETALTLACCGGFLEVANFLIADGAEIELGASTPLMEAAQEGHLELVKYLLDKNADVNAQTQTGDTALTYACENGHTEVARLLLQYGADLEHESEGGRTPLMKACRAGHACTVRFLLSQNANVNKQTTNNDHTPLSLAAGGGHLAVVELLLSQSANPFHKLKDNSTMLIEAAKGGHTNVVQLLLDYPHSIMMKGESTTVAAQQQQHVHEHHHHEEPKPPPGSGRVSDQTQPPSAAPLPTGQKPSSSMGQQSQASSTTNTSSNASATATSVQKSVLRKARQTAALDSNTLTSPEVQQVRNQPPLPPHGIAPNLNSAGASNSGVVGTLIDEELQDAASLASAEVNQGVPLIAKPPTTLSLETQFFQRQQIVEELQRVEQELKERGARAGLLDARPLSPTGTFSNLIMPTTPPGPPPDSSTQGLSLAGIGEAAVAGELIQLFCEGMVCGSTGVFAGAPSPAVTAGVAGNPSPGTTTVPTQGVLAQPQLSPGGALPTSAVNPSVAAGGHQPITTPSEVVQATAISDRPKAKPAWKKEGKTLRKQAAALQVAAFQAALQQQQQYFDQSTIQRLKNLVQITEEAEALPHETGVSGGNPSGLVTDPSTVAAVAAAQGKSVFSANHIMAHVTQQLDMAHLSGHDAQLRNPQDVLNAQCDMIQRRCPLISQVDEDALIELAKAGKLDQDRLDSLTEEDVRVLQSVEEMANSAYFTLLRGSNGNYQLPCQELPSQLPEKSHVGQQTTGRGGSGAGNAGGIASQTLQSQQLCPSAAQPLASSILPPPPTLTPSASGISSTSPTPPQFQPQLLLKAPPPCKLNNPSLPRVKDNSGLTPNAVTSGVALTTGGHVQAGTQTSPSTEVAPPPPAIATKKSAQGGVATAAPAVQQQAQQPPPSQQQAGQQPATNGASPVFSVTATSKRGKKYHYQPKSTQAPPVHSDSEHCFRCDGQAGAQGITPSFGMDVDSATDSNNDTALTLACAGGHEELVELLLSRGANIEHRDKKGFTPLILAATAGHDKVVEILMNHSADMEAQSERTKDTPLSLACSGGRYEVVELLLSKGANKEHRNVSDYTPLSLAASGGYVNIIKLLLQHGAEINSRTGSKLGISPLMLAAMNGHTAAVKLLLDMGSDINAQIETNRNTALTLACFQGRHEVVSLLLDRRANVEHRAKTGLTPLMEAASGGYVEVGRVLLDKGADVNAPPVPSSRDTALTIAADKGHCRFVELLLNRAAQVEVKNKKGNSPLWLAANGGHIAVVELLYNAGADIDSQDNRKVSCLMAAFRKGHVKVVKWMVNHVVQFPSDQEMTRFISTVNDKELLEKCQDCTKIIRAAKDQQAAKANKNASILLEELFMEKTREESKRAAAARRRERKKKKKMEKKEEKRKLQEENQKNERFAAEDDDDDEDQDEDDDEKPDIKDIKKAEEVAGTSESPARGVPGVNGEGEEGDSGIDANSQGSCSSNEVKGGGAGRRKEKKKKRPNSLSNGNAGGGSVASSSIPSGSNHVKIQPSTSKPDDRTATRSLNNSSNLNTSGSSSSGGKNVKDTSGPNNSVKTSDKSDKNRQSVGSSNSNNNKSTSKAQQALVFEPTRHPADREDFEATGNETYVSTKGKKLSYLNYCDDVLPAANIKNNSATSPKQAGKRDEGWKEVVRKFMNSPFKSKKVSVPLNAISRVIGRGGSNINAIRTATGAHIEVEKQSKGQGERIITLKGSPEAIKQAHSLIAALIKDPDVDILQILPKSANKSAAAVWEKSVNTAKSKPSKAQANQSSAAAVKTTVAGSVATTTPSLLPPKTTGAPVSRVTAPRLAAAAAKRQMSASSITKTTMSYTSAIMTSNRLTPLGVSGALVVPGGTGSTFAAKLSAAEAQAASVASANVVSGLGSLPGLGLMQPSPLVTSAPSLSSAVSASMTGPPIGAAMVTPPSPQLQRQAITPPVPSKQMPTSSPLPSVVIASSAGPLIDCSTLPPPPSSSPGASINGSPSSAVSASSNSAATLVEYSLFNDSFTSQSMWGREGDSQKGMNFASAAASSSSNPSAVIVPPQSNKFLDPSLPKVDASKAPGYRGNAVCSPVSKGCGTSSVPVVASTPSSSSSSVSSTGIAVVPSPYFAAPPPTVTHSEPVGLPTSYRAPPPPSAYTQAPHPPQTDPLDHAPYHPSSVSMSRLNPRAPDFSTSFKPQQIYQGPASNANGAAYLQQNLLPNSNVIFPIGKFPGNRPNGQARWPMVHGYPQSDVAHLASLAMNQTDLLGPLENGTSSNVSPSSPQAPPQADDRKIPRPIGTERAWKNLNLSMTSANNPQEIDLTGPQWLIEPKLNWQAATTAAVAAGSGPLGPATAPAGGLDSRHHIFRGTPNPGPPPPPIGPPFSRISLAEDMTHIMDTTYQGGLDGQFSNGGGISLMHALPVMNQQQHHYAAAMAAAAAVGQDLAGGGGGVTGGPVDWDQTARLPPTIQDLHQDKTHYYSSNQGWNKWNH